MKSAKVWVEKGWKISKHGNDYKQDGMWRFTIFRKGHTCRLYIKNVPTDEEIDFGYPIFYTPLEARLAAYQFLYGRHVTKETQKST